MLALLNGRFEVVKCLVENDANMNIKDDKGNTALIFASQQGNLEIVKYLIENGADVNAAKGGGETA